MNDQFLGRMAHCLVDGLAGSGSDIQNQRKPSLRRKVPEAIEV